VSLSQELAPRYAIRGFNRVTRVTIRILSVRETSISNSRALLPPGTVLTDCVVRRGSVAGVEPYEVCFHADGRQYACPLYAFQPRTEAWCIETQSTTADHAAIAV